MALLDTIQGVSKLATQIANPDLLTAVSDANEQAVELSQANLQLQKRVAELEAQVALLTVKRDLANSLFRNGDYVFRVGDPGACCPRCWDDEQKLMHVLMTKDGVACPRCKTAYMVWAVNPGRDNPFSVPI